MALARLINWPPTLEEIGFPHIWNPDHAIYVIRKRKAQGKKIYTGSYLLGAIPRGAEKGEYLVRSVLTPLHDKLKTTTKLPNTLEASWVWFQDQPGIGPFLSYEIVSDLRHTRYLRDAPDIMTWANAGPGALRGLTRLWGYQPRVRRIPGYSFPKKHALGSMQMLLEKSKEHLPNLPPWEMREVEHWLCELDKYERIRLGQGILEKFTPKWDDEW